MTNSIPPTRKPLTHVRQAETAKAEAKTYHLNAGDGLFLQVNPDGGKRWRFRYSHDGKRKLLSMGTFPEVSLLQAKELRDAARKLVAQGIDPSEHRQEEKAAKKLAGENSFAAVATEWLGRQTDKAQSTQNKGRWLLQFAIDEFGQYPISEVTPPMVLAACRKPESKGKNESAHRIKTKCGQVFRYAVATGRAVSDPTRDLKGALKPVKVRHRSAITDPKIVGQLLRDIDNYSGYLTTRCALKLAPLVFIRPGELRAALWSDIDLEAAEWRYTPSKTRNQTQLDHIVPLSTQAVSVLREMKDFTSSKSRFVFAGLSDFQSCMSENTVNAALRRMGYTSDQMCGQGFRATARTILEEVLGFRIEIIEQQLAHSVKDALGRAYNRTKHLPERKKMMQEWADYLDQLKETAKVLPFKKPA